ncbi:MAG: hypothetical protein JW829_03160 [Pirellulales bacterium]|nr:hypothetical protein [Pirellulales bacterium]
MSMFGPLCARLRPANVAMFHVGRSGSTVLGNLIDQHSKVFWDSEVFLKYLERRQRRGLTLGETAAASDAEKLLRSRMRLAGGIIYGCEIKFFHLHLLNLEVSAFVDKLEDFGFSHFVVLRRRNLLRVVVSSVVAHHRSQFHSRLGERAVLTQICLNVDSVSIDNDQKPLLAFLEDYQASFDALDQRLSGLHSLILTYEEDVLKDPMVAYGRLCQFLALQEQKPIVRFGRTTPFALRDILSNFSEVEARLRDTPFEWMTKDD